MLITIPSFDPGATIPDQYAYCKPNQFAYCNPDPKTHMAFSDNKNPAVQWSDVPQQTKSLVLLCVDDGVPAVLDDANKPGKIIPKDSPRVDFYHWVLVDINPQQNGIEEGEDSDGITEGGKVPGPRPYGLSGINSYSGAEIHGGYDGPCPPWNDELIHQYHFRLYALDVTTLPVKGHFTGADVVKAMQGHILDQAEWTGTYSLNPGLRR